MARSSWARVLYICGRKGTKKKRTAEPDPILFQSPFGLSTLIHTCESQTRAREAEGRLRLAGEGGGGAGRGESRSPYMNTCSCSKGTSARVCFARPRRATAAQHQSTLWASLPDFLDRLKACQQPASRSASGLRVHHLESLRPPRTIQAVRRALVAVAAAASAMEWNAMCPLGCWASVSARIGCPRAFTSRR